MEIVESWQDHNDKVYAIVRYSEEEQRNSKIKEDQFMFRYNNRGVAATKVERLEYHIDVEE